MRIGVPKEIKDRENRVALTPDGAAALLDGGHAVVIESAAGEGSGYRDQEYLHCGATIGDANDAWSSDLVVKIKEPLEPEYPRLRDQIVFTYFHLAGVTSSLTEALLDNETTLHQLGAKWSRHNATLNVWIDVDNGNGRSGIQPGKTAENLAKFILDTPQLTFAGLHVYDGHFAHLPIAERSNKVNAAFAPVHEMVQRLAADDVIVPNIVAGGSPTFPVHARQTELDLSPGTYTLWDMGYAALCPELPFVHAAVLLSRVISKPLPNRLCLDLGHKAVAAENPLENRVRFLNAPEAAFISQNEEHLVIELPNAADFAVGEVLYGIPWHICPTVALHQEAIAIDAEGVVNGRWPIVARNRRLKI